MTTPGHDPGHDPAHGFSWESYVDWLVERHGTLTAVAEHLASTRAFADDVASVERALRRLRKRGQHSGGVWGARALAAFGLPDAASARTKWMGAYHSRFTDLPLPLCLDLVRIWDRPPVNEAPGPRAWLALAHASCALRQNALDAGAGHIRNARASFALAPLEAQIEIVLVEAFLASRLDKPRVAELLDEASTLLAERGAIDPLDRACLFARWIDQRAYEVNHEPNFAHAENLYRTIPDGPAFAMSRRSSGLAYARWKQGDEEQAARHARDAARHAGDGGHVRLRAMALSMLARIVKGKPEAEEARTRAEAIVASLEDEMLRLRFRL